MRTAGWHTCCPADARRLEQMPAADERAEKAEAALAERYTREDVEEALRRMESTTCDGMIDGDDVLAALTRTRP